jgi:glycosyltransferase involved in cell wall biosynthesis
MEHNIFLLVVSIVCMASFLGYSAFMFGIYMRFVIRREKDLPYNHEPISIIIAARNEAENLRQFLPSILNQDRDVMEVIVVNDGSTDDTAKVLYEFAEQFSVLKVIHLEKPSGKKQALTQAIQRAKYDLLLFTDADCKAASVRWASEMASRFTPGIEIVLGYGGYEKRSGWLNKLIQLDTAMIAARYAGFAIWGRPYMGVGRNLAYRKSLWEKIGGFSSHADLPYGDDDLFIMQAANKKNTAMCFDSMAFTYSVPKEYAKEWFGQKTRHLHAGKRYKKSTALMLGSEFLFEALFWVSGLVLWTLGGGVWFAFLLTFYFLYKLFIAYGVFKVLNISLNIVFLPILSVVLLFALFLIGINAIFARQVKWKQG